MAKRRSAPAPQRVPRCCRLWVLGDTMRFDAGLVGNLLDQRSEIFEPPTGRIEITFAIALGLRRNLRSPMTASASTPALLSNIFERFVQGERSLQHAAGGLGPWTRDRAQFWSSCTEERSRLRAMGREEAAASSSTCPRRQIASEPFVAPAGRLCRVPAKRMRNPCRR